MPFAGTIRKIQHAAISHDRQQILHGAARSKAKTQATQAKRSQAVAEAVLVEEEDGVAAQLAESEQAIMQIEA